MTLLLALSSFFSRLLGVVRSNRLADAFGAGLESDAYFAAFQIPDLLYSLLVFGAISAAFVPLFVALKKSDKELAWRFSVHVLNLFLVLTLVVAGLAYIFADGIVALVYSSFDIVSRDLTVELMRIMLLSPLFFATSSIWSGIQTSYRFFWGYALAPIVYNLSIIGGIIWLSPVYGIHGVAYGVVLGAFLHALVQVIPCFWLGFRWRPVLTWDDEVKKLLTLGVPRILSLGTYQMNLIVEAFIAGSVVTGGLTVLRYAQDLQSFPLGIVGISVAVASFAVFSEMAGDVDRSRIALYLKSKIDQILFFVVPSALGLFVLREHIVHLILDVGAYDASALVQTEMTLAALCLGLVAMSLLPLISRVYYSFHDTWTPFAVGFFTLLLNAFLGYYLAHEVGIWGLGLSYSLLVTLQVVVLVLFLSRWYLPGQSLCNYTRHFLIVLASGLMFWVLTLMLPMMDWTGGWLPYFVRLLGMVVIGGGIYLLAMWLILRNELRKILFSK